MDVKLLLIIDWDFIIIGIYESFLFLFGNDFICN